MLYLLVNVVTEAVAVNGVAKVVVVNVGAVADGSQAGRQARFIIAMGINILRTACYIVRMLVLRTHLRINTWL